MYYFLHFVCVLSLIEGISIYPCLAFDGLGVHSTEVTQRLLNQVSYRSGLSLVVAYWNDDR